MTNTVTDTMLSPHFVGNGIIDFIEKPVPTPGTGELLIEVKADALCGSERHQFYDGTPTTPGHGETLPLTISTDLIEPERTIMGSEYFRFNELPNNLKLLQQHRTYLQPIITHTFPVTDIQHAFELFFQGNTGKVIIEQ